MRWKFIDVKWGLGGVKDFLGVLGFSEIKNLEVFMMEKKIYIYSVRFMVNFS